MAISVYANLSPIFLMRKIQHTAQMSHQKEDDINMGF